MLSLPPGLLEPELNYTESSREYVKSAKKSKGLLAALSCAVVAIGNITAKGLSADSMKNIRTVAETATGALKNQKGRRDQDTVRVRLVRLHGPSCP